MATGRQSIHSPRPSTRPPTGNPLSAMTAAGSGGLSPVQSDNPNLVTIKLFESFHAGSGDAVHVRAIPRTGLGQPTVNTASRYNRVHGSMDARWPGEFRMGEKITKVAAVNHDTVPVYATEWFDVGGIYPTIFYLVGTKIMKVRFGVVTEVGVNSLGSANVTGGMFDDDGSGVPYIYACFGGATGSAKIRRMNIAQTVTTSADVVAAYLLSLHGKAYRVLVPASGTSACQVSVCPYGSDRFTNANWGGGTTVGFAGTGVNALVAVRNAVVVVKPEGIFAYNQSLDQWINYTPGWRTYMHLDNGVGSYFLGDTLIVPMGDGGAVQFDGTNVKPFDPGGLLATPNEHTTTTKFTTMGAMRHWIVGVTEGCPRAKRLSLGSSLRFLQTTDGIAFTDDSAAVRDLDLTTFSSLPASATLAIYLGWDRPFTAFRFETDLANTIARTMTVAIGTAPATYTSIGAKNTGFRDFTELAGAPLGQNNASVVMMVDPVQAGWVQTTVNGITAYWVKLTFSGAPSAFHWANCMLVPWHPSIDATNFPLDGLDKSGNFPHIVYGREDVTRAVSFIGDIAMWHDMATIPEPDQIGWVLFGDIGGVNLNHSRNLMMIGRFGIWTLDVPADDRPGSEQAPFLNDKGLIEGSQIEPAPGKVVTLKEIRINGYGFDPTKFDGFFYYQWDWGHRWSRMGSHIKRFPEQLVSPRPSNRGNKFRWSFGLKQASAGATLSAPVVTDIEADFIVLPNKLNSVGERYVQSQPRT